MALLKYGYEALVQRDTGKLVEGEVIFRAILIDFSFPDNYGRLVRPATMITIYQKLALALAVLGLSVNIVLIDTTKNITPQIRDEIQKDELDIWLDKLSQYESCPAEGIIDTNHKKSYGCLCFQETTFKVYTKLYNLLPKAEEQEYLNMIDNCDFQKILAKKMIEDNYNNWTHWYWSVAKRGLGLPPR